jgi:TolB-like protein
MFVYTASAQRLAVVDFKVSSSKYRYSELSQAVRGMIVTKLALSSEVELIPISLVDKKLKSLKLNKKSDFISKKHLALIKKEFALDYLLTGEVKLTSHKILLKGKLIDFKQNKIKEEIVSDVLNVDNIYKLANKLTNILFKDIILVYDNQQTREIVTNSNDIDIMFLYNSKKEISSLLTTFYDNYERIIENINVLNPSCRIKVALTDVNPTVQNLPRLLDFTSDTDKVKKFLLKSIQLSKQLQHNVNEEYAIDYCIKNANWTVSSKHERYLFLLGNGVVSDFPKKLEAEKIITLAVKYGVKIIPLGTFNTPDKRKVIYNTYALTTHGSYHDVTYKVRLNIKNEGYKHFAVKDNQIYMFKLIGTKRDWRKDKYLNKSNIIDLSFGEKIGQPKDIKSFLKKRGFDIIDEENDLSLDNNSDELLIHLVTENYKRWIPKEEPLAKISIKDPLGYVFWVDISNAEAVKSLDGLNIGDPVFVGGQVVPTKPYNIMLERKKGYFPIKMNFFLNSLSIILKKATIVKNTYYHPHIDQSLIRSINLIKSEPSKYNKYGIFNIPRWFIYGTIKKIIRIKVPK